VNTFLAARFAESVRRLALGLEPIDVYRGGRIAHALDVRVEGLPARSAELLSRHSSCLHVLLFGPDVEAPVDVRLLDETRRYVPRRIRFAIVEADDVLAAEEAGAPVPAASRTWRPALFPGAAYDVSRRATGIRGRVLRGGEPLRWARVEARLPGGGALLGRAHGDDRGEFLLLLGVNPTNLGDLVSPLAIEVVVRAPAAAPVPATPDQPALDPYWDLPLEVAAAPGAVDPVSTGETLPAGYAAGVVETRPVDVPLGRISSATAPFEPA
jgi:hypothetical protein